MNKENIIRMAREVGLPHWYETEGVVNEALLIKFAALVASAEREKYEAVITNMTKLLEAQQNREGVAVDMIAAGIAAEREAIVKMVEPWLLPEYVEKIRNRGQA
jgi:Holliday junction resolvasome RuvABC ATP-dependent DNA helicase subunit